MEVIAQVIILLCLYLRWKYARGWLEEEWNSYTAHRVALSVGQVGMCGLTVPLWHYGRCNFSCKILYGEGDRRGVDLVGLRSGTK